VTQGPAEEPLDPSDADQVAAVFAGTLRLMGYDGVLDLLFRLPGVALVRGSPKRMFRAAVDDLVAVGAEHRLSTTEPVVHQHVVGGVVLRRGVVPPGDLPALLASLVGSLTRAQGSQEEFVAVLGAARDVLQQL
jgi:hypothetical protein